MKITQTLITCLLLITGLTNVKADTILGLYAGYNYWQHDLADGIQVNFTDEKNSEKGNIFYVALEHPVPFIPNAKIQHNTLTGEASGTMEILGVDGNPQTVQARTAVDLSHNELILYYELLDNWINLDVGASVKYFDGYQPIHVQAMVQNRIKIDEWIPLLYAKGQFDLPFTGLSAYGSLQALSLGSNDVTDLEMGLNYETKMGLGATLGFRVLDVDFDVSDNVNLLYDQRLEGFFLGVNVHF
ncbi:membrane protein [Marinicella pacifica]|uniref:Membrane protein n=1 Tax=Marinicella pacifica TaxID=1171543 RepID=A0A917CDV9_9GAMM|nr:TIGR04219 family outer membrane beta-barrel protein [Marinicella pacifica]GGF84391.1 membrane protein [Marinicella pacifica]